MKVKLKKYFLFILILSYVNNIYADKKEKSMYQLCKIDSTSFSDYYVFFFHGKGNPVVITPVLNRNVKGCWIPLEIGGMYLLTLTPTDISHNGIIIPTKPGGFAVSKKTLLKSGEYFYKAEEISGLMILYNK